MYYFINNVLELDVKRSELPSMLETIGLGIFIITAMAGLTVMLALSALIGG